MPHSSPRLEDAVMTRRELLSRSGMGMGAVAAGGLLSDAGLLTPSSPRSSGPMANRPPGQPCPRSPVLSPLLPKLPPLASPRWRVVHLAS